MNTITIITMNNNNKYKKVTKRIQLTSHLMVDLSMNMSV